MSYINNSCCKKSTTISIGNHFIVLEYISNPTFYTLFESVILIHVILVVELEVDFSQAEKPSNEEGLRTMLLRIRLKSITSLKQLSVYFKE